MKVKELLDYIKNNVPEDYEIVLVDKDYESELKKYNLSIDKKNNLLEIIL